MNCDYCITGFVLFFLKTEYKRKCNKIEDFKGCAKNEGEVEHFQIAPNNRGELA